MDELDTDETKEYYLKETKAPAGCVTPEGGTAWTTVALTADGLLAVEKTSRTRSSRTAPPPTGYAGTATCIPAGLLLNGVAAKRPGLPPQERYQDELIPSVRPPNW